MDWLTDDKGDWAIVNNSVRVLDRSVSRADALQETRQAVRERLRTFLGEYYLDTTIGVPYFQTILQKGVPQQTIEAIFRAEILAQDGVLSLSAFSFTADARTRTGSLTFTAVTVDGPITITESV